MKKINRRTFLRSTVGLIALTGSIGDSKDKKQEIPNSDCPIGHGVRTPTTKPCGLVYACGHPAEYAIPISEYLMNHGGAINLI